MTDWWSRQLGGNAPAPVVSTPPVTPPMHHALRVPAQTPQPAYQNPSGNTKVLDPRRGPNDQITMGEALRLWTGGEAARRETESCPSCGSHLVFSRSGLNGRINGASPAPRCYSCGWNGRYEQGDQSNWV